MQQYSGDNEDNMVLKMNLFLFIHTTKMLEVYFTLYIQF
jgi:hypothetical protein